DVRVATVRIPNSAYAREQMSIWGPGQIRVGEAIGLRIVGPSGGTSMRRRQEPDIAVLTDVGQLRAGLHSDMYLRGLAKRPPVMSKAPDQRVGPRTLRRSQAHVKRALLSGCHLDATERLCAVCHALAVRQSSHITDQTVPVRFTPG